MNKTILIGRLTKDPEIRYTVNNAAVTSFTVAVDRRFKQEGQPTADFIPVVAWNKTAEFVSNYFKKGNRIALTGRIQTRTYDDKDGKRVYVTEVVADEVEFVESKREDSGSQARNEYMPSGISESAGMNSSPQDGYYPIDDDGEIPF